MSSAHLGVDRARTAEMVVVLCDRKQPFAWHAAPACDVLQEWQYVFAPLWSAKADDEDRVVDGRISGSLSI